jgi:hypothetical protein
MDDREWWLEIKVRLHYIQLVARTCIYRLPWRALQGQLEYIEFVSYCNG